jgi:hypothetical protein
MGGPGSGQQILAGLALPLSAGTRLRLARPYLGKKRRNLIILLPNEKK